MVLEFAKAQSHLMKKKKITKIFARIFLLKAAKKDKLQ